MNRYFADIANVNTQKINWNAYAKQGQHVLIGLKASEGEHFVDRLHAERSQYAHKTGIWVIHYHFGHPGESASEQAQFFWSQIKGHFAAKDFACLDIEVTDGKGTSEVAHWVNRFDAAFRQASGHSLIGYASESFLSDLVRSGMRLHGNRWWIAAYGGPGKVGGVTQWAHQFTDGKIGPQPHSCAGIGNCDVSILNWRTYLRLRLSKPKV